jgi:sulfite exporter TauE/SafE
MRSEIVAFNTFQLLNSQRSVLELKFDWVYWIGILANVFILVLGVYISEEGMTQRLHSSDPFIGIECQHLLHQIDSKWRNLHSSEE